MKIILKEQIFEKYPGILLQPEKDFVAVVNLSEPEHDEKEIRSLLKTVEQFYSRTFHISACIMIGECQSDYKKMKEAYHLLEESMRIWNSGVRVHLPESMYMVR